MNVKSERLKKLENDLVDLEQWKKLGLVPKKDLDKHQQEIDGLRMRIEEEKARLIALKESGDAEEFIAPKRGAANRAAYQDSATMPGIDMEETSMTDAGFDMESEAYDTESTGTGTEASGEHSMSDEEEEDPFSDKNRWRRGIQEDPDRDSW